MPAKDKLVYVLGLVFKAAMGALGLMLLTGEVHDHVPGVPPMGIWDSFQVVCQLAFLISAMIVLVKDVIPGERP